MDEKGRKMKWIAGYLLLVMAMSTITILTRTEKQIENMKKEGTIPFVIFIFPGLVLLAIWCVETIIFG
jgi:hypothetical protein